MRMCEARPRHVGLVEQLTGDFFDSLQKKDGSLCIFHDSRKFRGW